MLGRNFSYYEQKETDYTLQLRQLLTELPPYAKDYFRAAEQKTSLPEKLSSSRRDLMIHYSQFQSFRP